MVETKDIREVKLDIAELTYLTLLLGKQSPNDAKALIEGENVPDELRKRIMDINRQLYDAFWIDHHEIWEREEGY